MREKGLHVERKFKNLIGEMPKLSLKDKIDFCPLSVLMPNRAEAQRLKEICADDGSTRQGVKIKTGFDASVGGDGSISIFNPDLAQKILALYAPKNAEIIDQFGGGGTRGIIAAMMGHKYTGIELRAEEVKRIEAQKKKLNLKFDIIVGDAKKWKPKKNKLFDFSFTCPPYYDLEIYSNDIDDISFNSSYGDFLSDMRLVLRNNYAMLKPGAFSVWVVGNFRNEEGYLRHFNGDLAQLAHGEGFRLWDELIWQGAAGIAARRSGQFLANRKIVRIHEYILVFKKS